MPQCMWVSTEKAKCIMSPVCHFYTVSRVPPRCTALKVFTQWHVAYHGTTTDAVKQILFVGDLLMPGTCMCDVCVISIFCRPFLNAENHFRKSINSLIFYFDNFFYSVMLEVFLTSLFIHRSKLNIGARYVIWNTISTFVVCWLSLCN